MCKINCSGGCFDCAPDEHAASVALEFLEKAGFEVDWDRFNDISSVINRAISGDKR